MVTFYHPLEKKMIYDLRNIYTSQVFPNLSTPYNLVLNTDLTARNPPSYPCIFKRCTP